MQEQVGGTDLTGGVVVGTHYVTLHLASVILTGKNRVVVILSMGGVVTQQDIVLVLAVQTTHVYTKTGKNQDVNRNGDTTGCVVI